MAAGLLAWLAAGLVALAPGPAQAKEALDCPRMLSQVVKGGIEKEVIQDAQRQLADLKFDPQKIDGKLGPLTKESLLRFCQGAKYALSNDLLDMLDTHAAIVRAYPDWVVIFGSRDFAGWTERQADAKAIADIRAGGDAAKAIWVLDRFRKYKSFVPTVRTADDALYSYILNEDDFKQLKSTDGLLKRIGQLRGKPFVNPDDFDAALEAAFKGVVEPDRFIQLVRRYAQPEPALALTEKSQAVLKGKGVPDYVLQAIQPLQGQAFADGEIEDAVSGALAPLTAKMAEVEAEIAKFAELSPSGARFRKEQPAKFAETFKDDAVANAFWKRLQQWGSTEFRNDKEMAAALKSLREQEEKFMNQFVPEIVDAAENVTIYSLGEEPLAEIKEELSKYLVPEIFLQLTADLKGVDFPDGELLWAAMRNKVALLTPNDAIRRAIFGRVEKYASNELEQSMLDKLKGDVPPAVLGLLSGLLGKKFDDTKALENEVERLFADLGKRFDTFKPVILAQARKRYLFGKTKPIEWNADQCNCVRQDLAGVVYGFYPYWFGGEKHSIDFSVVSRIGYYALGFDDKGNVPHATQWAEQTAGFIEEARRYGTKVDLVIRRSDWESWNRATAGERASAFGRLASSIAGLLAAPLDGLSSAAAPYISLGLSSRPVRGDGVTLDFGNYPRDSESVDLFIGFIQDLGNKLQALDRPLSVNLAFRSTEIGTGIHDYSKLIEVLDKVRAGNSKLSCFFLVTAQEPTTLDKKRLRTQIENGLHGRDRMKLLRAVVMVLVFGGNELQLVDDIIYANDNFGGIGFWTQPFVKEGSPTEGIISKALQRNYVSTAAGSVLDSLPVCRYICPNKWAFRAALDVLAVALLLTGILYVSQCAFRILLGRYFLHFLAGVVAPFVLVGMALLACDPGWAGVSRGNGLLIIIVGCVIAYAVWSHFERKKLANLP